MNLYQEVALRFKTFDDLWVRCFKLDLSFTLKVKVFHIAIRKKDQQVDFILANRQAILMLLVKQDSPFRIVCV